jgi:hypothetical protein
MQPTMHTGPKGGRYVILKSGEKAYVPPAAVRWTLEAGRWRVWLSDGRKMLYPPLRV